MSGIFNIIIRSIAPCSGILFLVIFLSCNISKKPASDKNINQEQATNKSSVQKANNEAKITATIISIDPSRDTTDRSGPCFRASCYANIRIEKVERRGSLFHMPENLQEEIRVYFALTLSSTNEDLFPNMGVWYPGLKINDKFEAVIQSRLALEDKINYTVYEYKILNK